MSLGIDLASKNAKTAACLIEWGPARATVVEPQFGDRKDDGLDWLVELCGAASCVGIDAPFGWPEPMVDAVWMGHRKAVAGDRSWGLRLRVTDQAVVDRTKLTPLSVSSDRIAIVAWRCAQIPLSWRRAQPMDRVGADGVYEVYPGAALTCWGLDRAGYKTRGTAEAKLGQRTAREKLIEEIARRAPWLDLACAREACVESDDALDALLASLVARAAALGKTAPPPADHAGRIGGRVGSICPSRGRSSSFCSTGSRGRRRRAVESTTESAVWPDPRTGSGARRGKFAARTARGSRPRRVLAPEG